MWLAQVVLEIAMGAAAEDRTTGLAIMYDELMRQEIEDKCGQLGLDYDFSEVLLQVNETSLRRAKRSVVSD